MAFFDGLARQYIDGEWRSGAGSWDLIDVNPYDGEKLASITVATADEVDLAYRSAERAQRDWAGVSPYDRRLVFERALRIVEGYEEEITRTIIAELGGTYLKSAFELFLTKDMLRESMSYALRTEGKVLASPVPGKENRVYRNPVGVVGVISPYNFPLFLAMKSVAPAIALGNAVVLKPHQSSPVVGGTLIAKIFEEAGLPPGVLNVVVTDIAEIGDAFIEHPVPRVLSFTGSDTVGRHVATVAAKHFKRTVLEMGGNSALIVLDDADVDYAVDAAVFSRFAHQGQVCMAANRVLVDRSLEAEFTEKFVARVRALKVGDPADPSTDLGPLINDRQAESVTEQVAAAVDAGATALVRGRTVGTLVEPTVLTGIAPGASILRRELFGPVVVIVPFDGDDEAVEIANDTPFGLSGAVHTADTERGVRIAHRIDTGMIHVNDGTIADEAIVPFGGEKNSGVGRLNGESTVDAFTTVKWISIQHGRSRFLL
ncbi:putative aldehyde dehydrogenase YfmT [Streptomyces sp. RB5]|uniref:Putative aldehyde dehydrogenase YfmT n=1 Tax=Streptomyces smaragdinus TaxID=2585196 RepID=A0A7K0CS72_9ACTN|nr:aldehyde dehydrogenase family protein [Streptomyces smaragdinus]MQY16301.1 putative aldehyde dehydrogenase YfmT [Streptomyces smaragdinus]